MSKQAAAPKEADYSNLIAAAPDLLEACEYFVELLKHHDYTHEGCDACAHVKAARAAIAKARKG